VGLEVVSLSIGLFASTYMGFRWNIYIFSENISMEKNLFFGVQLCSSKCFEKHFQAFGLYEKKNNNNNNLIFRSHKSNMNTKFTMSIL
jgi:hypothetical protein